MLLDSDYCLSLKYLSGRLLFYINTQATVPHTNNPSSKILFIGGGAGNGPTINNANSSPIPNIKAYPDIIASIGVKFSNSFSWNPSSISNIDMPASPPIDIGFKNLCIIRLSPPLPPIGHLKDEVSLKNIFQKSIDGNLHMSCVLAHLPFLTVLREFEQDFFISFAFFPSLLLQSNNGWMTNHHSSCSNIVFFVDNISYLLLNFFIATKKNILNETIVTKMGDYPLKELVLILFLFAFSDRIVSLPLMEVSQ